MVGEFKQLAQTILSTKAFIDFAPSSVNLKNSHLGTGIAYLLIDLAPHYYIWHRAMAESMIKSPPSSQRARGFPEGIMPVDYTMWARCWPVGTGGGSTDL